MGKKIAGTANVRRNHAVKKDFDRVAGKLSYLFNSRSHDDGDAEKIALWNRFIPLSPAHAAKILRRDLPPETVLEMTLDDDGQGDILLYAPDMFNDDGDFDLEEKTLDAGLVRVLDGHKGKGYGRTLFRNQVEFFYNCGVRMFEISASLDNGGYTWARVGFLPDDVTDDYFQDNVIAPARESLDVLRPLLSKAEYKEIEKHLDFKNREDIWHIADTKIDLSKRLKKVFNEAAADTKEVQKLTDSLQYHFHKDVYRYMEQQAASGGAVNIGRLLLTGTQWEGSLDMTSRKQMQRMADYTGGFKYIAFK